MLESVTYDSKPQLARPRRLLGEMLGDLKGSRELATRLLIRNLSARYRQTALGYAWAFLPPIFTTLTFVFLSRQKVFSAAETAVPYAVFVMTGSVLWQGFIDALNFPLVQVNASKQMLAKVNFPREALMIAGLGEVLFSFAIRMLLLALVLLYYRTPVPSTVVFVPLGFLALSFLGMTIGVILTPIGLLYRDVQAALSIIAGLWFFLTPVVYPVPTDGGAKLLSYLNPVSPLIVATRDWLLVGSSQYDIAFAVVALGTVFAGLLGWLAYRISLPHVLARIGS